MKYSVQIHQMLIEASFQYWKLTTVNGCVYSHKRVSSHGQQNLIPLIDTLQLHTLTHNLQMNYFFIFIFLTDKSFRPLSPQIFLFIVNLQCDSFWGENSWMISRCLRYGFKFRIVLLQDGMLTKYRDSNLLCYFDHSR